MIAVHSTRLGPGAGGTRMRPYPSLTAALQDACQLARSMTYKFAAADFPLGDAKAVIALPAAWDDRGRTELLQRFGTLVRQLRGLYVTGPDVGTSATDMDVIGTTGAPYVFGRTAEAGGSGSSAPPTALGVYYGIEALAAHLFGAPDLRGRRVLVQGAGGVGQDLIPRLQRAGAEVLVSEIDPTVVQRLQDAGVVLVPPDQVSATPCDIFAPCALGGVLNRESIAQLRCRGIAGAANNQLATTEDAERLRARGIVYVPDFVVNSGGAITVVGVEALGWSLAQAEAKVRAIGDTVRQVLQRAEADGGTTEAAARQLAEQRLAQAPGSVAHPVVVSAGR
ncbi:MAG: Glu/Leu/Phe/Val dehydrogenase [Chloroflexales bacterium]|nr:Glu/Leu/Phe/Val dehydrogenase [Chloroflexales bacterium]